MVLASLWGESRAPVGRRRWSGCDGAPAGGLRQGRGLAAGFLWLVFWALAGVAGGQAFADGGDKALEAEIRARLEDSVIGQEGFTLRVVGGVVYWDGRTAVAQRKGAATRMAKSAGAVRVENRIQVTSAGKRKLAADLAGGKAKTAPPPQRSEPREPRRVRVQWRARGERR